MSKLPAPALASLLLLAGVIVACAQTETRRGTPRAPDLALETDLARGGRLYDKWYKELGLAAPTTAHPAYPASGQYADKVADTWRCKECHGWDFAGKDGAYATGKHYTGIPGIRGSEGADVDRIVALLKSDSHGYGAVLNDVELRRVALFVSRGQFDMDRVIDRETKVAQGDADRGATYYATICAGCHGPEGKEVEMPVLGEVANKNPWETLNKILNGQPHSEMPALRALDRQVSLDVLRFTQTLPQE